MSAVLPTCTAGRSGAQRAHDAAALGPVRFRTRHRQSVQSSGRLPYICTLHAYVLVANIYVRPRGAKRLESVLVGALHAMHRDAPTPTPGQASDGGDERPRACLRVLLSRCWLSATSKAPAPGTTAPSLSTLVTARRPSRTWRGRTAWCGAVRDGAGWCGTDGAGRCGMGRDRLCRAEKFACAGWCGTDGAGRPWRRPQQRRLISVARRRCSRARTAPAAAPAGIAPGGQLRPCQQAPSPTPHLRRRRRRCLEPWAPLPSSRGSSGQLLNLHFASSAPPL